MVYSVYKEDSLGEGETLHFYSKTRAFVIYYKYVEMIPKGVLELNFVGDKLMLNKENLYEDGDKRWRDLTNDSYNHVYRIKKYAQKGMKKAQKNILFIKFQTGTSERMVK